MGRIILFEGFFHKVIPLHFEEKKNDFNTFGENQIREEKSWDEWQGGNGFQRVQHPTALSSLWDAGAAGSRILSSKCNIPMI